MRRTATPRPASRNPSRRRPGGEIPLTEDVIDKEPDAVRRALGA